MTQYKVIVRRDGYIISENLKLASSDREKAEDVLKREARKFYGDNVEIEIH